MVTRTNLTVAGQRRTYTGFVFQPSHPGERRLARKMIKFLIYQYNHTAILKLLEANSDIVAIHSSSYRLFGVYLSMTCENLHD
jgi:hypothetical protein